LIELRDGERLVKLQASTTSYRLAGVIVAEVIRPDGGLDHREVWKCSHKHEHFETARDCAERELHELTAITEGEPEASVP
jgi:hypothetical protein